VPSLTGGYFVGLSGAHHHIRNRHDAQSVGPRNTYRAFLSDRSWHTPMWLCVLNSRYVLTPLRLFPFAGLASPRCCLCFYRFLRLPDARCERARRCSLRFSRYVNLRARQQFKR
jgi:hypothetical protein